MTAAPASAAVSASGLTRGEVAARRADGRGNDYPVMTSRPLREILRANVLTRFNALLGSLLVVILLVGPLQDALFGLTLVANTLVGIVQEVRAKRALDRLAVVTAPRATVVREGATQVVAAADVVLDDLMEVGSGDQLVADATVLDSAGLRVDESLLTGESRPVDKLSGDGLLSGSWVVAGSARCRVTAVGAQAYAARLEAQARQFGLASSELRDGINLILRGITWVLVPTAVLLFWSQLTRAGGVADALRGAVAGTVTMVPEGLILLTSVAFAVGALRLARQRVLTRELASVEGLARVDTLCIDKTGTLTSGRLTVTDVVELVTSTDLAAARRGRRPARGEAELDGSRPHRTLPGPGAALGGDDDLSVQLRHQVERGRLRRPRQLAARRPRRAARRGRPAECARRDAGGIRSAGAPPRARHRERTGPDSRGHTGRPAVPA